jgi:hypothetical protein
MDCGRNKYTCAYSFHFSFNISVNKMKSSTIASCITALVSILCMYELSRVHYDLSLLRERLSAIEPEELKSIKHFNVESTGSGSGSGCIYTCSVIRGFNGKDGDSPLRLTVSISSFTSVLCVL